MLSFYSFYINVLLYMEQEIDLGTLHLLVGPIPVALSHRGGTWSLCYNLQPPLPHPYILIVMTGPEVSCQQAQANPSLQCHRICKT